MPKYKTEELQSEKQKGLNRAISYLEQAIQELDPSQQNEQLQNALESMNEAWHMQQRYEPYFGDAHKEDFLNARQIIKSILNEDSRNVEEIGEVLTFLNTLIEEHDGFRNKGRFLN